MTPSEPFLFSWRLVVTILCFWSVSNMIYLRLIMSVTIVCMVNRTHTIQDMNHDIKYNSTIYNISIDSNDSSIMTTTNRINGSFLEVSGATGGNLQWDSFVQGQVLGSYMYGYAVSKIPTGWVMRRVGGKILILASSVASSITCLLTPIVATNSATGMILLRVLLGLCGGMVTPAVQGVLSNWSPPSERSRMGSYTFAGFPCGTLVAFTLAGLLCESGFAGGWPSVFYTFGIVSLIFCVLWVFVVTESPGSHPFIRKGEKDYIEASLVGETTSETKLGNIPWTSILTSPAVYAVVACAIGTDFVGNVFLLYLPTYMVEVMSFDLASSGLLSALPFLFCFLAITVGGHVSDCLIEKTKLTKGTVRKMTSGSGMLMCLVSLITISFMSHDEANVAVALLVVSMAGIGLTTIGYFVNPLDIAPKYSGLVVAIVGLTGDISGFISPAIVAAITSQGSSPRESWQIVFLMSAGVTGVCLIVYICFASGEVQPWARPSQEVLDDQNGTDTEARMSPKQSTVTEDGQDSTERLLRTSSSI